MSKTVPNVIHQNIISKDNYFGLNMKKDGAKDWDFVSSGRDVKLKEIQNTLETNDEKLLLHICSDPVNDIYKEAAITRDYLHRKNFDKLLLMGIDVQDYNAKVFLKYMQNQEQTAKRVNTHIGLGFDKVRHPVTGMETLIYKAYKAVGGIESTYAGSFNIKPKGSYNEWLNMVKTQVIGHTALEFGLSLGFVGTVKAFLREHLGSESTVVNIPGRSSIGKSSVGMLAVSVGGFPEKGGLQVSWNTTSNALEGILNRNYGLPILIDEASTKDDDGGKSRKLRKPDLTKIIYVVESGSGKHRLDKNSMLKESFKWLTVVISTAEESLLDLSNQNTGLRVRLVEIHLEQWTTDAKHSDAIKNCVRQNYGFAAPMVAEYLLNTSVDELLEKYEELRQAYVSATTIKDEYTERVSKNYALFLLSADIANEVLKINIDIDKMLDFFVENERANYVEKDLGTRAYDYILQAIETRHEKFGVENKPADEVYDKRYNVKRAGRITQDPVGEVWGKRVYLNDIDSKKYHLAGKIYTDEMIVIAEEKLYQILDEGGFNNPKVILKKWKKDGLLDSEDDRLYRKRSISQNGVSIKTYVILVEKPEDELDVDFTNQPSELKTTKAKPKAMSRVKPISIKSLDDISDDDGSGEQIV